MRSEGSGSTARADRRSANLRPFAGTPTPELKKRRPLADNSGAARRHAWGLESPVPRGLAPLQGPDRGAGDRRQPRCAPAQRGHGLTRAGEKNSGHTRAWTCAPERDEGGTRDACGGQHLRAGGGTSIKAACPKEGRQPAFDFSGSLRSTRGDNCETNCVSRTR
ncbi:hypothetical protein ERJ75_000611200 [Trypanosoma vivax]|nr:hypothetical protein ERJ75_000611200 [Trypanosoma vivax]